MADRLTSTPIRAGIGLLSLAAERARQIRLDRITEASLRGLGMLASAREAVERTYEELANRGETVIARRRGMPEPRQTPKVIDLSGATPGATLAHDELPLDDYDHLTLGSLRARLPRLDAIELAQLRDYERVHANRLPVLTLFENRLAKINGS